MIEILERLAAARIQLLPLTEIATHFVFERAGFVCLVERKGDGGFGGIGAPGLLTGKGFAALVLRGDGFRFVGRGFDEAAEEERVRECRSFARDLETALRGAEPSPDRG